MIHNHMNILAFLVSFISVSSHKKQSIN